MAKVENLTDRGVPLLRWRILPKGVKALNPRGDIVECVPDSVAYSDAAKRLADSGVLWVEGYSKPKKKAKSAPAPAAEPVKEMKPDDETAGAPAPSFSPKKKKGQSGGGSTKGSTFSE